MSILEFYKFTDLSPDHESTVPCTTIINLSRFLGIFALLLDLVDQFKSSRKCREISYRTLGLYTTIYFLEILDCLVRIPEDFKYFAMIPSILLTCLTLSVIIGIIAMNDLEDIKFDDFSWPTLLGLIFVSFVLSNSFIFKGRELFMIFNSCLNTYALLPQFYIIYKTKTVRRTVGYFITGMIAQTFFMIPGAYKMIRVRGLEAEYHQLIFIGITHLVTLICVLVCYPRKIVDPRADDNNDQQIPHQRVHVNDHAEDYAFWEYRPDEYYEFEVPAREPADNLINLDEPAQDESLL